MNQTLIKTGTKLEAYYKVMSQRTTLEQTDKTKHKSLKSFCTKTVNGSSVAIDVLTSGEMT